MVMTVNMKDRSYNIFINDSNTIPIQLVKIFPHRKFILLTNTTIEKLYKSYFTNWENVLNFKRWVIDDGEHYKTINTWKQILDFLLESKCDRDTIIIAFGGGVIGDISGFVASTFLRGIRYIQVPTTLLAMVDSSIGGKTGVNHPMGKNLIGSFYQPQMVWIQTSFLKTLPHREFMGGCGEVIKYAFVGGRKMFDYIVANIDSIQRGDPDLLEETIRRCIEIKTRIVSEDEKESGVRVLLNFGHTFGHALECFYEFKNIIHGEGVYWGIACAIELGKISHTIPKKNIPTYDELLSKLILPPLKEVPDIYRLYPLMFSDKKVREGTVRFIVPTSPGQSILKEGIGKKEIIKTLKKVFEGTGKHRN